MKTITTQANNHSLLAYQIFFVLLWSSGALVIETGLHFINPFFFVLLRMLIAATFMLAIAIITKAPWPKDAETWKKTIVTGILTQFIYVMSYFCALYYGITPTVMTIILGLQPILTAVLCNIAYKHKTSKAQTMGLLIGLLGVILIVIHDLSTKSMSFSGCLLAVLCLLSITLGSLLQKSNSKMDLRTGSAIQFAVSIIPVFILTLIFGNFKVQITPTFIASLAWMAIVVSVIATCLFYKLLEKGNAVSVSSLFYLVPGLTAIMCYFIFQEKFNTYTLIGLFLVSFSVFITQAKPQKI